MHLASADNSQQSFRETLSSGGLRTKADFAPLHGRPDSALGGIVGGLDAFMGKEGKEVVPILQRPFGPGPHQRIIAVQVMVAIPFHPPSDESGGQPELRSRAAGIWVGMPVSENGADLLEHIFGEEVCVRA